MNELVLSALIRSRVTIAEIKLNGMKAANRQRADRGEAQASSEESFNYLSQDLETDVSKLMGKQDYIGKAKNPLGKIIQSFLFSLL